MNVTNVDAVRNSDYFTAGDGSTGRTLIMNANVDDRIEFHIFDSTGTGSW